MQSVASTGHHSKGEADSEYTIRPLLYQIMQF